MSQENVEISKRVFELLLDGTDLAAGIEAGLEYADPDVVLELPRPRRASCVGGRLRCGLPILPPRRVVRKAIGTPLPRPRPKTWPSMRTRSSRSLNSSGTVRSSSE